MKPTPKKYGVFLLHKGGVTSFLGGPPKWISVVLWGFKLNKSPNMMGTTKKDTPHFGTRLFVAKKHTFETHAFNMLLEQRSNKTLRVSAFDPRSVGITGLKMAKTNLQIAHAWFYRLL